MTGKEALAELEECIVMSRGDPEVAHSRADHVLCELLRSIGYDDVVEAWEGVKKWYA